MALKLTLIVLVWALAILDVLAPGQFVFKNPLDAVGVTEPEVTESW